MPLAHAFAAWRRAVVWAAGGVLTLLLVSCASPGHIAATYLPDLPERVELVDTPFFPDDSHFCGPAALATSLSAAGLPSSPETLIDQVFLPGRQGSLQVEMLAAARRQGAVATRIPGRTEALWRELAAGHPVVVLQNLGLSWAPSWHYAVVVGYDAQADTVLLRSGPMKRQALSLRTFMYTWNRSERWAFVTTRPGQLPVTATEADTVQALVALERNVPAPAAVQAYRAGVARWPANATLAMGLGNALYAAGDKQGAEAVFRQVIESQPLAAAYNNLARLLLERGNVQEARAMVERGLPVSGPLRQTLLETLEAIETASQTPK